MLHIYNNPINDLQSLFELMAPLLQDISMQSNGSVTFLAKIQSPHLDEIRNMFIDGCFCLKEKIQ